MKIKGQTFFSTTAMQDLEEVLVFNKQLNTRIQFYIEEQSGLGKVHF